jgi:hypothetical protein
MTEGNKTCETCGKPKPDKKAFRELVVLCHEKGWYVLEDLHDKREVPYCRCKAELTIRLEHIRHQRDRIKRKMIFGLKFKPHQWKSKRFLLERKAKTTAERKAIQRQIALEDEILWGGKDRHGREWILRDTAGKRHPLEDVLDAPLVRQVVKSWPDKSINGLSTLLSLLARDPALLSRLDRDPSFLSIPGYVRPMNSELEGFWKARIDDPDYDMEDEDGNLDEALIDADLNGYFWPDEWPTKK